MMWRINHAADRVNDAYGNQILCSVVDKNASRHVLFWKLSDVKRVWYFPGNLLCVDLDCSFRIHVLSRNLRSMQFL